MSAAQSHAPDEWRPGFAKRAPNFEKVCGEARSWSWQPGQTVGRVVDAVIAGAHDLSMADRGLLALYVSHLNQERLEQGDACVWPSTELMCRRVGCGPRAIRMARARLERRGYMVRDYTRTNRPAGAEAFDLRPLLVKLEELEARDDEIRQAFRAEREALRAPTSGLREQGDVRTIDSAREEKRRHLEQSQENSWSSVRGRDAALPRHGLPGQAASRPEDGGGGGGTSPQRRKGGEGGAIGSPARASGPGGASSDPKVYAEMVRQELRTAAQLCPRLAPLVTPALLANPLSASPEDAARVVAAAAELLPQPDRNNDQTARWGWRKHGIRVLVMLAIAIEDPEIRSPCSYFGKLTGQDRGAADLRLNLARILASKGEIPAPPEGAAAADESESQARRLAQEFEAPPGSEDPKWQAIAGELQRIVGAGKWGSWFGRVGFHGLTDGVLHLSSPTGIAADRIKSEFLQDVLAAAEAAEIFVERVVVTVRRS